MGFRSLAARPILGSGSVASMERAPQPEYVFAESAEEQERRRLAAMEEDSDPGTFRRLERLGLGPGHVFLEIGPGGGSLARWACERVGAAGRVVAIDADPRFVSGLRCPNLEVRPGDIRTANLEAGAYDLVHARNVLLHLPDCEAVLHRLVAAAQPGGWLLIEDLDLTTQRPATDDPAASALIQGVFGAIAQFHRSLGIQVDLGRRLPSLFQRAGLRDVGAETELPLVPGGSTTARSLALTLRGIAERMTQARLAAEDSIRQFVALLEDPACWMMHAAKVAVWGRRS